MVDLFLFVVVELQLQATAEFANVQHGVDQDAMKNQLSAKNTISKLIIRCVEVLAIALRVETRVVYSFDLSW